MGQQSLHLFLSFAVIPEGGLAHSCGLFQHSDFPFPPLLTVPGCLTVGSSELLCEASLYTWPHLTGSRWTASAQHPQERGTGGK